MDIKHGDLVTLANGDLVEVSLKVVKKKEIVPIPGKKYRLTYTGEFCHWYKHDESLASDKLPSTVFQFIGFVDSQAGRRAIFYDVQGGASYAMFSTDKYNYITAEV